MRKLISVILVILLCLSMSTMTFAGCDVKTKSDVGMKKLEKIKKDKKFAIISDDGQGNYSFVPSKDVTDKKAYIAEVEGITAQDYSTTCQPSSEGVDYYNGNRTINQFNSNINVQEYVNIFGDNRVVVSGTSSCSWLGATPFNADSITDCDNFSFSTLGVSVSLTYPPAIGAAQSSSSCTLQYPVITNNWNYSHSYNGISCQAWDIYGYSQSKTTMFLFGTRTATPGCAKSIALW